MLPQELLVRYVVRHLAQPVHVVGKAEEPGWNIRHQLEGLAHHRRAHHLAKGADVRQPRGTIARFEEDIALLGRLFPETSQRSEERRVGKECRSWCWRCHRNK